MGATVERLRFTVDDFFRMGTAGILDVEARLELIEGDIVPMAPIGSRHAWAVIALNKILVEAVGDEAIVSPQNPIALPLHNAPQPDLCVLRRRDDYADRVPRAEDVLLLIEVADTTLTKDRGIKAPIYARYMIPEVWIIDIQNRRVEILTEPGEGGYARSRVVSPDEPLGLPGGQRVILGAAFGDSTARTAD